MICSLDLSPKQNLKLSNFTHLLVPLALISTRGWQRRLGKRWRILPCLVYLAIPVSVWHYLWLDRDFMTWPIIYVVIVGILHLIRLPFARPGRKKRGFVE
jgi:sulfoxide reductase heme-binding subunit YedZ